MNDIFTDIKPVTGRKPRFPHSRRCSVLMSEAAWQYLSGQGVSRGTAIEALLYERLDREHGACVYSEWKGQTVWKVKDNPEEYETRLEALIACNRLYGRPIT